jgi:hypothetical protein
MEDKVYGEPSEVAAQDGVVVVDGPDAVAVLLTPEAAEETGHRLLDGAAHAQGQRIVRRMSERKPGESDETV